MRDGAMKNIFPAAKYFGTVYDSAAVVGTSVVAAAVALAFGFHPMATVGFVSVVTGAVFGALALRVHLQG